MLWHTVFSREHTGFILKSCTVEKKQNKNEPNVANVYSVPSRALRV